MGVPQHMGVEEGSDDWYVSSILSYIEEWRPGAWVGGSGNTNYGKSVVAKVVLLCLCRYQIPSEGRGAALRRIDSCLGTAPDLHSGLRWSTVVTNIPRMGNLSWNWVPSGGSLPRQMSMCPHPLFWGPSVHSVIFWGGIFWANWNWGFGSKAQAPEISNARFGHSPLNAK
jgi:hypothetical protein